MSRRYFVEAEMLSRVPERLGWLSPPWALVIRDDFARRQGLEKEPRR
jgi:hypothetical protein